MPCEIVESKQPNEVCFGASIHDTRFVHLLDIHPV